jgi:divalent metal cation (Fe/Co/Zn/Cd) transporter
LNILKEGWRLIWRSSQGLMDEALEPEVLAVVRQVLDGFATQQLGSEAIRFDHLYTRKAGQRRFVDVHMHLPANWTLGRAAAMRGKVEQALMRELPGVRATIELLPSDVEVYFDENKALK